MAGLRRRSAPAPAEKAAPAKKTAPPKKKEAPAAAPAAARGLTSRKVTNADIQAAFAGDQQASGTKTDYLKLGNARNIVRLLPAGEGQYPLPYRRLRAHRLNSKKPPFQALDLDTVFENPLIAERLTKAGKLTKADYEKWQQYGGDPFNVLAGALKNAGIEVKERSFWPSTKYLWNAINRADGKLVLWESGKGVYDTVAKLIGTPETPGEYPELFDLEEGFDLLIEGNGEDGFKRRYAAPVPARKPSSVEIPEGATLYDLDAAHDRNVVGYDAKVLLMFREAGKYAEMVGLTLASFGMSGGATSPPNSAADMDEAFGPNTE